jgi:signal transduction histidine kinase
VFVDRDMWEKVVLNLLSNAFKFTFDGEIVLALAAHDGHVELTIRDTGIGIANEELPRLFERFHRVEGARARTHEGSGIGLALVHELVRLHGGTLAATSELDRGTTFTVSIPFGHAHLPPDHVLRSAGITTASERMRARAFVEEAMRWLPDHAGEEVLPADASSVAFGERRVLVADDNADMREYITRLLAPVCHVETVANGREALDALRTRGADVLLTDVMMPEMDGLELLRTIRGDAALRGIPVIVLSARSGDEARIEGLQAGADDYLFKPFSARELVARVSSQLELARARQAAATERDRLRSLLSHVPAIVNFLKGPEFVFDFVHPLASQALGGRALQGRALLDAMPEHDGQPFVDMVRRVYDTGEPYEARQVLARLDRSNTGHLEESYWNVTYVPVRNTAGDVEGVMTFDIEVTEQVLAQKRVEEQTAALVAAREQAETATRAKDEFLAMLGHELRNPLAPILTALELMRLRGLASREQDVIRRQVGHLTRLVDDLLDISRITRGKIELALQPMELATIIARAMELASPLLEQRQHRVLVDIAPRGLGVCADADRLSQVVVNLLTNAAKYSDPESTIAVSAARTDGIVELRVRDEGVGIPPQMLDHIFESFVQQRQTIDRSQGGLGLGLTIVRTLVEKHGGTVHAHSAGVGKGSEFIVRLPFTPVPDAPVLSTSSAAVAAPSRAERVLVVDDNEDAAEMLQGALEYLGYTVAVATDGAAALVQARAFKPNIALLDIGLPVMDGYEVAERLRAELPADEILLIAVTGYGQEHDRKRSREAGFSSHLVKPIELSQLQDVLSRP